MHKISVAEFVSWPERVDIPDFVESAPSLRRSDNSPPSYAQLYILDLSLAMQQRMNRNSNFCPDTMGSLQELLKRYHSYVAIYKQAYEILQDVEDVKVRLRVMPGQDPRDQCNEDQTVMHLSWTSSMGMRLPHPKLRKVSLN
ncbi:hypothetical protein B0H19DRAFT_1276561 [Mycena capillaripes]|nr:hypothetical protein B0H19DRAFT_1276561 [Mycena capillaripes]